MMRIEPCPECGWMINVLEAGDEDLALEEDFIREAAEHEEVHQGRVRRIRKIGMLPKNWMERDELLEKGWEKMRSDSFEERVEGAEMHILSGFHYSISRYLNSDILLGHPLLPEYAASLDLHYHFKPDVADHLREKYGPPPGPFIDWWSMTWGVTPRPRYRLHG
jgi:hypothetical protein